MSINAQSVPLSLTRTARIFDFTPAGLRGLLRRKVIGIEQPVGGWLRLSARDLAGLLILAAGRAAGLRKGRLHSLWSMVAAGFAESDRTGFRPFLVLDVPGGWARVLMVHGEDAARLVPPEGVQILDLQAIAERFALAIALAPASPREAEEALRRAAAGQEVAPRVEEVQEGGPAGCDWGGLSAEQVLAGMKELGQPVLEVLDGRDAPPPEVRDGGGEDLEDGGLE